MEIVGAAVSVMPALVGFGGAGWQMLAC
jgi:hypothetical protein